MNRLTVKYPSRQRPALFKEVVGLYLRDPLADLLVSIDADDSTMNCPEMLAFMDAQPRLKYRVGNSKNKVQAVNDGLDEEPWDGVVCVASDDMIPQRDDYAQRILAIYDEFFPEGDGVLHLNDGRVGRALNTLPICDRNYYDRFGFIYYAGTAESPGYKSLFCDNEWQDVSERLGRAVYVPECVVQHRWIGDFAPDALWRHNELMGQHDGRLYETRKRAGFPSL